MRPQVFARIAESVIPQLDPAVIVQVLEARLADTVPVRLAALKALCAFLGSLAEGQMSVFQVLLPSILGSVSDPHAVSNEAEPQTKEMLEILVELVEYSPRFFRPAINDFCSLMVALASGNVPESLRQLSVEWIVTLAEAKPTLGKVQRKVDKLYAAPPRLCVVLWGDACLCLCLCGQRVR